jgi:hypothetical protein
MFWKLDLVPSLSEEEDTYSVQPLRKSSPQSLDRIFRIWDDGQRPKTQ